MSRKFNVGDRVRIVYRGEHYGDVATIIGVHINRFYDGAHGEEGAAPIMYAVDIAPPPRYDSVAYEPHELEPHYDGNEKVSWSTCAWKPNNVSA